MQPIEEFLAGKPETTIHTTTSYVRQYLAEQWRPVLEEREVELQRIYAKAGEYAYGVYARALFAPLRDEFHRAGFHSAPEFPGAFEYSIEHWGPPEERERCLWSVVQAPTGELLGTIVIRLFHDHTRFRLPHAPAALALTQTDEAAIVAALADPATRRPPKEAMPTSSYRSNAEQPRPAWEYSVELGLGDCLDGDKPEISEAMLDYALARWGRYGWELVTVVPHGGRLAAFFRRPGAASGHIERDRKEALATAKPRPPLKRRAMPTTPAEAGMATAHAEGVAQETLIDGDAGAALASSQQIVVEAPSPAPQPASAGFVTLARRLSGGRD